MASFSACITLLLFQCVISVDFVMIYENTANVVRFSTETNGYITYPTPLALNQTLEYASSVICGNMYYSSVYDEKTHSKPNQTNLFEFNIESNWTRVYSNRLRFILAMTCTDNPDVLLAVVSDYDSPYDSRILVKFTFYDGELFSDNIGSFPSIAGEYAFTPRNFAFNPYANEVWGVFPDSNDNSRQTLQIMDTDTGKIKAGYYYPSTSSYGHSFYPYFAIPATLKGNAFNGAVYLDGDRTGYEFVTIRFDENSNYLNMTADIDDAVYLDVGIEGITVCKDTAYYMFEGV